MQPSAAVVVDMVEVRQVDNVISTKPYEKKWLLSRTRFFHLFHELLWRRSPLAGGAVHSSENLICTKYLVYLPPRSFVISSPCIHLKVQMVKGGCGPGTPVRLLNVDPPQGPLQEAPHRTPPGATSNPRSLVQSAGPPISVLCWSSPMDWM